MGFLGSFWPSSPSWAPPGGAWGYFLSPGVSWGSFLASSGLPGFTRCFLRPPRATVPPNSRQHLSKALVERSFETAGHRNKALCSVAGLGRACANWRSGQRASRMPLGAVNAASRSAIKISSASRPLKDARRLPQVSSPNPPPTGPTSLPLAPHVRFDKAASSLWKRALGSFKGSKNFVSVL